MLERSTPLPDDPQLEHAAARFLAAFEHVFGHDWTHTQACLQNPSTFIEPEHTFVNPGQFDEANNWSSRLGLLESYRCLAEELIKRGAYPYEEVT